MDHGNTNKALHQAARQDEELYLRRFHQAPQWDHQQRAAISEDSTSVEPRIPQMIREQEALTTLNLLSTPLITDGTEDVRRATAHLGRGISYIDTYENKVIRESVNRQRQGHPPQSADIGSRRR